MLLRDAGGETTGFALCHSVPLVEGRTREELRVLKLALRRAEDGPALMSRVADFARRCGARRAAVRVQGEYETFYGALIAAGARVRWTDLRMTFREHVETRPAEGVVLSNWEI